MYIDNIKVLAKSEKQLEILMQILRKYSKYVRMEFGIEKCVMLMMKSGKREKAEGIELSNQEKIRTLGKNE